MRNLVVLFIHFITTLARLLGPGGVALCWMFNRAIRGQRVMPNYLSSDNDPLYRFHQWQANLRILESAVRSIR